MVPESFSRGFLHGPGFTRSRIVIGAFGDAVVPEQESFRGFFRSHRKLPADGGSTVGTACTRVSCLVASRLIA